MNQYSILVEDRQCVGELKAEHGLSIFFSSREKKFLFDTGQSNLFLENAEKMGVDLSDLDYVVLSHGHYDHTGGLQYLPEDCEAVLVAHPDYKLPKYLGERFIGLPAKCFLKEKLTKTPFKMSENVFFLGEIPGSRKPFGEVVDVDGSRRVDMLYDDTGVVVLEGDKAVVLCGCAHSGIVNIARYVKNLYNPDEMILVGGFHLHDKSRKEIMDVVVKLKELNISAVYCGHCTGEKAAGLLLKVFGGEILCSGMRMDL